MRLKGLLKGKIFPEWFGVTATATISLPYLLFLRFVGGTWLAENHHYPTILKCLLVATSLFAGWILYKILTRQGLFVTGLELHLLPFLAVVILSSAFSYSPNLSLEKAIGVGFYIFTALLVIEIKKKAWMWQGLIIGIIITALITTAISFSIILYTFARFQFSFRDLLTRLPHILNAMPTMPAIVNLHPTISAGYYLMVFPLIVFQINRSKKVLYRILLGLGLLLTLIIVIMMKSRGSIIGLAFMTLSVLILASKNVLPKIGEYPEYVIILGLIIFSLITAGIFYIIKREGFSFQEESIICRLEAWKISLGLLLEHPLLGSGMETFGLRFLQKKIPTACSAILHVTHNDFLQILVNFGLAGLAALAYFFYKFWLFINNSTRVGESSRNYSLIALAGMAGMGVMSTVTYSPNIVFLGIFYLVWMIDENKIVELDFQYWKLLGLLFFLATIGSLEIWTVWRIEPYFRARIAAERSDWATASANLKEAINRDPGVAYYQQTLAYIEGQRQWTGDTSGLDALDQYYLTFEEISEIGDDHASAASLWAEKGNYLAAVQEIEMALYYSPINKNYYCILGSYLTKVHQDDKALIALSNCIVYQPTWLDTPFWDGLGLDWKTHEEIIGLAADGIKLRKHAEIDLDLGKLFYFNGQLEIADYYLDRYLETNNLEYDAFLLKALIAVDISDYKSARYYNDRAIELNPRCLKCWMVEAAIAYIQGNNEDVEKALKISSHLGGSPETQLLFADVYTDKGNPGETLKALQSSVNIRYHQNLDSHWIASRWHLADRHFKYIPLGLTYSNYYHPVSVAGKRIEKISCHLAKEFYLNAMSPDQVSREYFQNNFNQLECSSD